jgi:hypothetical protein
VGEVEAAGFEGEVEATSSRARLRARPARVRPPRSVRAMSVRAKQLRSMRATEI